MPLISIIAACRNGANTIERMLERMAEAIRQVVYSSERIGTLKALGRDRAKRFSWNRCASETLAVYRRLQDSRR